jgi:hypothetical protein
VDDYQLAYAHYVLTFPTLASLGDAPGYATWRTEYDRVNEAGLSATLLVNTSSEGASAGAIRNFPQKTLLAALHARRAALVPAYLTSLQTPAPQIGQVNGSVIRLGY